MCSSWPWSISSIIKNHHSALHDSRPNEQVSTWGKSNVQRFKHNDVKVVEKIQNIHTLILPC